MSTCPPEKSATRVPRTSSSWPIYTLRTSPVMRSNSSLAGDVDVVRAISLQGAAGVMDRGGASTAAWLSCAVAGVGAAGGECPGRSTGGGPGGGDGTVRPVVWRVAIAAAPV